MSQIRSLAVRDGNEVYDAYLSSLMKLRWSEKQIMRLLGNLGELWCVFIVYGIRELAPAIPWNSPRHRGGPA